MAYSSGDPDSLVELRFHDFRAERMRHWWTLLGGMTMLASWVFLASSLLSCGCRLTTACSRLSLPSGIRPTAAFPSGRVLGRTESWRKYLGLTSAILRPEISRVDETWQKANISLDLLMKYFSWSVFPTELTGDFIASEKGWKKFRTNDFQIAFAGYYPSLALRQFGGVQYPPRLGDLSLVIFDYVPDDDMWRSLSWVESIWGGRCSEMVLVEGGLHADSSVTPNFSEWREGWSPSFTLRPTVRPGVPHSSVPSSLRASTSASQSERVVDLERELEETRAELASLRLVRASEREESAARVESMRSTLHHSNAAVANLRRRPHDIVALWRALDESEVALTAARTSIGVMRVQISVLQGDNGGFLVVTALHQVNQVMDSLGATARAVLEEHDEGDPAFSTALGRFCRETCIRLGH
uniref:Uncharacterized protein n=1 Tax=Fagus sylvatica TaxID=28930 RepID=A0A2N9I3X0_FAGSY